MLKRGAEAEMVALLLVPERMIPLVVVVGQALIAPSTSQ
jgi:hypothetical protein